MHHVEAKLRPVHAALLAAAVGAVACSRGSGGPPPGAAAAEGPRAVLAVRPAAAPWPRTIELGGTLEAPERVEIAARIEGAVTDLEVDLGDRVARGDTLARITPEDFAARLAQTDAELGQARSERERLEQLTQRELASVEQLEQARTRERVIAAQRRVASRQLRDTRIVAPFDGAIAQRLVSPGAFVRVGTPLFVLVATSPLRLALDVPERHAGDVREGTSVTIHHEGGGVLAARVARVAPIVDPTTRTFRVHVDVPADDTDTLRAGMYVRALIELGVVSDAVRLPRAAVFEVLGRSRVVEIVDGRARPRDVELLGEDEGAAIVRGLSGSHDVVVRSPGLLAPGTEVAAEPAPEAAARAEDPAPSGSGGT